jgi:hypothetical protein
VFHWNCEKESEDKQCHFTDVSPQLQPEPAFILCRGFQALKKTACRQSFKKLFGHRRHF